MQDRVSFEQGRTFCDRWRDEICLDNSLARLVMSQG